MTRLHGKTVLITGATSGIGKATAQLFVQEGAQLVISGQNRDRLQAAQQSLQAGADVLALQADQSDVSQIERAVAQLEADVSSLDVVFLNAGVTWPGPIEEVTEEEFDGQVAINFKGPFFWMQKTLPLLADEASVIVTASSLTEKGMPGMGVYAATKAALRSLVRTLAAELVDRKVRVNALSPGPTETPIYDKIGLPEDELQAMATQITEEIPMHRFGDPTEIAQAALFLASDDSAFMLGDELVVDGGHSTV
jgi:NAD(P)-dependent dehydrogenase (short-subunit alcohol dehydrogenase family)